MRYTQARLRRPGAARALLHAAALLLSLHGFAGAAAAQPSCTQDPCGGVGDEDYPSVGILPVSATYSQPSVPVVIAMGDVVSLRPDSLRITLNDTVITAAFQYTPTPGSITPKATARGTIMLRPGSNTLRVRMCDQSGNCNPPETAVYTFGVPGVSVSPDGGTGFVARGNPASQTFTITNTGPESATFGLQAVCREVYSGAAVSGCTVSHSSVTLNAGAGATVSVAHDYGAAGTSVSVELRARHASSPTVQDLGWVEADVRNWGGQPYPMTVSLVDLNSTAQVSRDECVTVSVGPGAAYECGDLRLAHGVPGMATLGRARAPVLLYNSQHASPKLTVYADVTLPEGVSPPQQVVATVTLANGAVHTRTFTGSDWWPGMTRRIGVQWDGSSDGWWVKGYTLQVTAVYANVQHNSAPLQGEVALVNRMNGSSSFGAGWWLAGLEQINCVGCPNSNRGMHQSGDGSTRIMQELAWNLYVVHNPEGAPDTITLAFLPGGAQYTRKLRGGGEVHFDAEGRHVRTVSRLNDTTHFSYDGLTRRLLYASVPGRDGVARGFRFNYTGGYLTSVTPEINGAAQPGITLTRDGPRVLSIVDPDNLVTLFGYADTNNPYRITSRRSRDTTLVTYGYDAAGKLSSASLALSGTKNIVTTFQAAESRGVNPSSNTTVSAALVSEAYTLIDGPRGDVVDQTRIWVTNRGAPRRIRDPMGGETLLRRTHATYPSLVTEVLGNNARGDSLVVKSTATYDGRGRVLTSTAVNPLGNGQNLTTTYTYDDLWDAPDTITAPGVGQTVMAYDPQNGNVLWQQQGDATRRVNFHYYTSGPSRGLLSKVLYPHPTTGAAGGGGADSLGYDGMGNLRWTRSPMGYLTYHYRDTRGRDSVVFTPVRPDSADTEPELQGNGTRMSSGYDLMGRVAWTESVGRPVALPASADGRVPARIAPTETLRVETEFDAMGRPRIVNRWSTPDVAGAGVLRDSMTYDRAGRMRTQKKSGVGAESFAYDPAGNVTTATTPRGHQIKMEYDALGRLVRRSVPAASDPVGCPPQWSSCPRFPYYSTSTTGGFAAPAENFYYRYDALGNQVYAENLDAIVRRTYHPGGALRTDSTFMRAYSGMSFSADHAFGLEYRYDAVGRLRALQHPANLAGAAQADSFAYDATTGAMNHARTRQGYVYTFQQDLLGRPVRTGYPGGGAERTTYDAEGRRLARVDSLASTASYAVLASDTYTYDVRGKMTYVYGEAGSQATHFRNWYSGLGNLLGTEWSNVTNFARVTETFVADAMGNQAQSNRWVDGSYDPIVFQHTYQPGRGRIANISKVPPVPASTSFRADSTYRSYDNAGNVTWGIQHKYGNVGTNGIGIAHQTITRNYYGADNTVRVVQVHDQTYPYTQAGSYAEYRYDPLGRRIMERTRRDEAVCHNNGDDCQSTLTRFVWAGDQLLWELRVPGGNDKTSAQLDATNVAGAMYGRVSYFHAGGIDKPLLITKEGVESVVPRDTWRGQFHAGTSPSTGLVRDCPVGVHTGCLQVNWPGWKTTASHAWGGAEAPDIDVWYGGLVDGMRDASGQMYMRNRYYDPATGQFTQPDPIGLAGGLNAYGFAAGDPVSYSDPYGLCAASEVSPDSGLCPGGLTHGEYYMGMDFQQMTPNDNSISTICKGIPECRAGVEWAEDPQINTVRNTIRQRLRTNGFCGEIRRAAFAAVDRGLAIFPDGVRDGGFRVYGMAPIAYAPYPRPGRLMFLAESELRNAYLIAHEALHGVMKDAHDEYIHGDMTPLGVFEPIRGGVASVCTRGA